MNIQLHTFSLQLKSPFRISHGSRLSQPTLIVEMQKDGLSGYGEATATSYYGLTIDGMVSTMKELLPDLVKIPLEHPEQYYADIFPILGKHPFLRCALDIAANDLWGKMKGIPLHQYWFDDHSSIPLTNYTIGLGDISEMLEKIAAFPWPIYKIKLGGQDDRATIAAIRKATVARLRIDANTGWTPLNAFELVDAMAASKIEMIEQPLPVANDSLMPKLKSHSNIPFIADESCQILEDVEKCAEGFDGINIKLMKCGGLTPARQMIQKAQQLGLQIMVGCMTESSIGIAAIAQLLPALDYVDMDGPLLIQNDPGQPLLMSNGIVTLPKGPGTGAILLQNNPV